MLRYQEEGWREIGKSCSANRRSMWLRLNPKPEAVIEEGVFYAAAQNMESFELCAGREGDDAYVKVDPTNPQFEELLDLVTTALFAAET